MSTRRVDDVYAGSYRTAWGIGWVYVRDGLLIAVDLPGEGPAAESHEPPQASDGGPEGVPTTPGPKDARALAWWAASLEAYFAGEGVQWIPSDVPLGALGLGTFEQRVYEALLSVPAGETVGYGELAEMAGYPRAARAVGNAMAANPIPIVVPCHRVIRSDGSLGRYGNDPTWKARLLDHERRAVGIGEARTEEGEGS